MKHVQENLEQYKDWKFFNDLKERVIKRSEIFEAFDESKDKSKNKKIDPKKQEEEKVNQEAAKDAQSIIKKVIENFNRFKSAAGGKIEAYKQFWGQQLDCLAAVKKQDPTIKRIYCLYDSDYLVGIKNVEGKISLVVVKFRNLAEGEENPIFSISNDEANNQFLSFIKDLKIEMQKIKEDYIKNVENKRKEEERLTKRKKLDNFLKA
jgi:hypothetical protein